MHSNIVQHPAFMCYRYPPPPPPASAAPSLPNSFRSNTAQRKWDAVVMQPCRRVQQSRGVQKVMDPPPPPPLPPRTLTWPSSCPPHTPSPCQLLSQTGQDTHRHGLTDTQEPTDRNIQTDRQEHTDRQEPYRQAKFQCCDASRLLAPLPNSCRAAGAA